MLSAQLFSSHAFRDALHSKRSFKKLEMTISEHAAEKPRFATPAAGAARPFLQIVGSSVKLGKKVVAGFLRARFRGEIYDYARLIGELGSGYLGDWRLTNLCIHCRAAGKAQCAHFEIGTARHLMGPFKAILDPNVKVVMLLKAAQTAGSTVWDLTVHYLLVHSPFMRIKVLMDSNEKAQDYCQQKLMETLRRNPDIKPLLPTGADRFGVTDTELRLLNGKILTVAGLNETNASSLPSDVMILDEGWIHQSDGLMKKAFMRLKQTKRGKIIVVGQAGNVKEDQDVIWNELDARIPLTWACPCCGGRQQFELHKSRGDDFKAVLPRAKVLEILTKHGCEGQIEDVTKEWNK